MGQQQNYNESKIFSERLRQLRGRLTQAEFARKLGIASQQTYGNYEKGRRVPKPPILQRIAQRCGVSIDWLLGSPDQMPRSSNTIDPERRVSETAPDYGLMKKIVVIAEEGTPEQIALVNAFLESVCKQLGTTRRIPDDSKQEGQ